MTAPASSGPRRTGVANLPLHYGKAPRWLFERMTLLAREVCIVVVSDYGSEELLRKLSDPFWFQALGCALGFDWHSSGLTTTVCGAIKEGIKGLERDLGLFVAGGKGRTSRQTPAEIERVGPELAVGAGGLVYASRMAAKVDSAALQDGYQLYHHVFFFTPAGQWAVVQQGMNTAQRYARRYHWLGEQVADFVSEPHAAICSEGWGQVLNLVAAESDRAREAIAALSSDKPEHNVAQLKRLQEMDLPSRHHITTQDIDPRRLERTLLLTHERSPADFEQLLGLRGVGAKTLRALSLLAELVHGVPPSFRDPARFSFAHGGKDGHPYPVDRETYDRSIDLLRRSVGRAGIEAREKAAALKRLESGLGNARTNLWEVSCPGTPSLRHTGEACPVRDTGAGIQA